MIHLDDTLGANDDTLGANFTVGANDTPGARFLEQISS